MNQSTRSTSKLRLASSSRHAFFRLALPLGLACVCAAAAGAASVKIWEEETAIPTYLAGPPEPSPMFYFGQGSQGAAGHIYPYSLYDTLTGKKENKTYRLVRLENEYLRLGILPEIGGRLFEAVDKSNNYDFVYRQHVIKPALIGLIGAWISGGVEWNIPHHHRATTALPVQYRLEEGGDGSKTVWVGELELRHRMRWAVGYTLRPGKAYVEVSLRILNRTPVVNSFLCFANVAVSANEHYQVIFPPATQHVTFHSKHDFTTWPIATTRYSGIDFTRGVDVSWYSNHQAATSMFAWNYTDDFLAGYDHGRQAGTLSVTDHHIVPGKKFWTWGGGPRGKMWEDILTDHDGPYIELMVGAYSDNQPDYSWLEPFEVKSFKEFWYPFRDLGGVKSANLDAAVNLEVDKKDKARVGFCVTSAHGAATVRLKGGDVTLLEEKVAINPAKPWVKQIALPAGVDRDHLRASIEADGKELVAYTPVHPAPEPMPKPVEAPGAPDQLTTVEELYLTGLRIEQFHSPALEPEPYWEEALRRDPGDVRVNTALGIRRFKRARYAEAEKSFRTALDRLTANYTTPKDGEPIYYLGLALKAQGRTDEAFETLFKATWSAAWRAPAYYSLAEIACRRGNWPAALDLAERSLEANSLNVRALTLKAAVLRHLGRDREALALLDTAARASDPLDVRIMAERWLASKEHAAQKTLDATFRDHPATALETAAEFVEAGLWTDGAAVMTELITSAPDKTTRPPLVYYYRAFFRDQLGQKQLALEDSRFAVKLRPDYGFPFQAEVIPVLEQAMRVNPTDARAPYYLGNLLFDWQPERAIQLWRQSAALDPSFPMVHRNLAVAWAHEDKTNLLTQAISELEQAVSLSDRYPIHFFELDQLYEANATNPEKRLALLEAHEKTVLGRDDATTRLIALEVFAGRYDNAIARMKDRSFNIWEGGGRFSVTDYWTDAHLGRGRHRLATGQPREALADFQAALQFPVNLHAEPREGAIPRQAEISYWTGMAHAALGEAGQAHDSWTQASEASGRERRNGGGSERNVQRYFQALALRQLGQTAKADPLFRDLLSAGTSALKDQTSSTDFFAAFGERQPRRYRAASAHYLAALGHLGLGEKDQAREELTQTLRISPDHLGAKSMLGDLR